MKKTTRLLTMDELFEMNTIGIKKIDQTRVYRTDVPNGFIEKKIIRMKYLKICCQCGSPYETYKYNSYACCNRCRQDISFRRKKGLNSLGNMEQLTKEKRTREVKERFGYN